MKTHTGLTCGRRNKELANFTDNGAFLPLKMLISRSLKCPYLHYKHCSPALRQRRSAVEAESCSAGFHAAKQKNAALESGFTFPPCVTFRYWLGSWKDGFPQECVSVFLQKIRAVPTEQPYIFKMSLFCWLCWAMCYTQKISQPRRITGSSQNNHCFTVCLTHCEQGGIMETGRGR